MNRSLAESTRRQTEAEPEDWEATYELIASGLNSDRGRHTIRLLNDVSLAATNEDVRNLFVRIAGGFLQIGV
ncbi:hypothetical protein ACX80E_08130 [Arthrobacter sp. TMN-49]